MSASWTDRTVNRRRPTGGREHSLGVVVPFRSRQVNPNHPSVQGDLFDQDDHRPECVVLTNLEAQLIASLLNTARAHLPSPIACDEAISLLVPHRKDRSR